MEFFISNFLAVLQIFVLGSFGFYILKWKIKDVCVLSFLTNLVIDITLPCFIFSSIIMNFPKVVKTQWYIIPLSFFGMLLISFVICILYFKIDRKIPQKNEFISLVSFQNVGYLPIVIVNALFPQSKSAELNVYIFLFVMFFNPVFFTLSETLLSGESRIKFEIKQILNPVFIVTALSIIIGWFDGGKYIPEFIIKPISLVGQSTIPISMIVIGGTLIMNFKAERKFDFPFILKVSFFKLIIIPAVVIFLIKDIPISNEIKFVIFLEALVPPAVNNLLLARKYEGSYILVGQTVFISHLFCLITIPIYLSMFRIL